MNLMPALLLIASINNCINIYGRMVINRPAGYLSTSTCQLHLSSWVANATSDIHYQPNFNPINRHSHIRVAKCTEPLQRAKCGVKRFYGNVGEYKNCMKAVLCL